MNAGNLTERITLKVPIREVNEFGREQAFSYTDYTRWAKVEWKGSRTFQKRDLTGIDADAIVTVRYDSNLDNISKILIEEKEYTVINTYRLPHDRGTLEITVSKER